MNYLAAIYAFLQVVLYILTWRATAKADQVAYKKALEVEADEAIRSGNISAIVAVWDKLRS